METLLEMKNIVKRFGDVTANDHVNLRVKKGEIHGLLGENGAGKTTLMNILFGLYRPDEGEMIFEGRRVEFRSPRDAISAGIGMVHQHFMLVPRMTVLHNLILGYKTPSDPLIDEKWVERRVERLSGKYGISIPLYERIMDLSVGEEQRVEILKALFRDVKLLILDEPTAVLTPPEVQSLFSALRSMTEEGLTVIFITHKLKEALTITDRITVLRKGKNVGTVETAKTNERELAKMMVGREVVMKVEKPSVEIGDVVLKVQNLWVRDDRGLFAVRGVSFTIREGEILGIAGVSGNGQRELEEAIAGIRKVHRGSIFLYNREITSSSDRSQIAYIPEDRIGVGLAPSLTVMENLMLKDFKKYRRGFSLNFDEMERVAERLIEEFSVKTPSVHVPASTLSGGNIQRLILAREFSRKPKVIIASQPTRGLDIAGIEYVRTRLIESARNGCAILLISEDLDEIFQLSDRIAVMYEGEIKKIFSRNEARYETVGYLMAGGAETGEVAA
ncbi:ABC transporter ATP-binding protein [Archaeoglobus neptunius]|uniref:ABC transporter ATP-binding protein n=1 Tax=Archaeoglobus neptunius TaxID=2798580 RepID=UPI001E3AF911|nr:ABC transporter ATP-binding protein [Archaeoglobus neptunius]